MNNHQQALDLIVKGHNNNTDWYLLVLKIAKYNPKAIINAFGVNKLDEELLNICQFIPAIKRYREITGKGLKESKDYVEDLFKKHGIVLYKDDAGNHIQGN